jgi:hypothetical protein
MDTDGGGWTRLITLNGLTNPRKAFYEDWPDDFDAASAFEPQTTGLYVPAPPLCAFQRTPPGVGGVG